MEGEAATRRPLHCVLWHAPDAPPTFELTALLIQRGLTLETCDNPYAAAARVCRAERAARAQRRAALSSDPDLGDPAHPPSPHNPQSTATAGLILLLAEPTRLPMRDAIARVLELHAPRTLCWVYERHASPSIRTVPLPDIAHPAPIPATAITPPAPASHPPVTPPPTNHHTPIPGRRQPTAPLSLVSPAAPPPPPDARSHVPINPASLLSDEELAMLLADDDPPTRRSRTSS